MGQGLRSWLLLVNKTAQIDPLSLPLISDVFGSFQVSALCVLILCLPSARTLNQNEDSGWWRESGW